MISSKCDLYSREQSSAASCAQDEDIFILDICVIGEKNVHGYVWLTAYLGDTD